MKKKVCFKIEGKELYLDQILVDYNSIPVFYVCNNLNDYYIVLCTDFDEECYIIVKTKLDIISNMLHRKITMREIITCEKEYWDVKTGDSVETDVVQKKNMDSINLNLLPDDKSYFQIASDEIRRYVNFIDAEIFNKFFFEVDNKNERVETSKNIFVEDVSENATFTMKGNKIYINTVYDQFLKEYNEYIQLKEKNIKMNINTSNLNYDSYTTYRYEHTTSVQKNKTLKLRLESMNLMTSFELSSDSNNKLFPAA